MRFLHSNRYRALLNKQAGMVDVQDGETQAAGRGLFSMPPCSFFPLIAAGLMCGEMKGGLPSQRNWMLFAQKPLALSGRSG